MAKLLPEDAAALEKQLDESSGFGIWIFLEKNNAYYGVLAVRTARLSDCWRYSIGPNYIDYGVPVVVITGKMIIQIRLGNLSLLIITGSFSEFAVLLIESESDIWGRARHILGISISFRFGVRSTIWPVLYNPWLHVW
ncbi:hypothetical protein BDQ94DRAFT_164275 [Aspergillus welwitschiae]|uniref:Uncharacterized protein n=1 Tax=Aspergillus welwitschiae TaxID=1341132 RepID=A0A3F3PI91_9EURO|nr:hypothetical protein BDQ94DRAFT_164275 [Aspergillus welwitschiae]RDH26665.1 hypothetical protein BDQ94DRAFT_164275 [Aspergillus welwitschiae]